MNSSMNPNSELSRFIVNGPDAVSVPESLIHVGRQFQPMSYVVCPDCGKKISVFGESHVDEVAAREGIKVLAKLPMNPDIAQLMDAGKIEYLKDDSLAEAVKAVEEI